MWMPKVWETPENCPACRFSSKELLTNASPAAQEDWTRLRSRRRFLSGSLLFGEGENSVGVYLLRHGRARFRFCCPANVSYCLRYTYGNEVLGLTATIAGWPYEVTAEAVTLCDTDFVARADFLAFLRTHSDVCYAVTQFLSHKLSAVYHQFSKQQQNVTQVTEPHDQHH